MSDIFETKLEQLGGDEAMVKAIKFVFDEEVEKEKPVVDENISDEVIGQKYRAYVLSKKILSQILTKIGSYNQSKVEPKKFSKEK